MPQNSKVQIIMFEKGKSSQGAIKKIGWLRFYRLKDVREPVICPTRETEFGEVVMKPYFVTSCGFENELNIMKVFPHEKRLSNFIHL